MVLKLNFLIWALFPYHLLCNNNSESDVVKHASIVHQCNLGLPKPDDVLPNDRLWVSNTVLSDGVLHILQESIPQKGIGFPCIQQDSSGIRSVMLKDAVFHVSPGQGNWGEGPPGVIGRATFRSKYSNLLLCTAENTFVDPVIVFSIRGYPMFGHIIFNTLSSVLYTMWSMNIDAGQGIIYATIDRRAPASKKELIAHRQKDRSELLETGKYSQFFNQLGKDGVVHNWMTLSKRSFEETICFRNISIGHSMALDLFHMDSLASDWRRFANTMLTMLRVPLNPSRVSSSQCNVILISRKNRKIVNEIELVSAARETYPDCSFSIVDFEHLSFASQASLMHHNTSILIGIDGSGLLNALYLRPCSVVVRVLPAGGDLLTLAERQDYRGKGREFENIAVKVGAKWLSYSLMNFDASLIDRHHPISKQIEAMQKGNTTWEDMRTTLKQKFDVAVRMNYWKYYINSAIHLQTFLDLIKRAKIISKECTSR